MTTFTQFEEQILICLYQEHVHGEIDELILFKDIVVKYGLVAKPGWLLNSLRDLVDREVVTGPKNAMNDDMAIAKITGRGMRQIEEKFGSKSGVGTIIEPVGVGFFNASTAIGSSPSDLEVNEEGGIADAFEINSSTWTGISERAARSPQIIAAVSKHVSEIDNLVESLDLNNFERARLKAITNSLQTLVESPEPEWKAIVALLQSPTLSAILGLAGIVQLTLKVIFGIG